MFRMLEVSAMLLSTLSLRLFPSRCRRIRGGDVKTHSWRYSLFLGSSADEAGAHWSHRFGRQSDLGMSGMSGMRPTNVLLALARPSVIAIALGGAPRRHFQLEDFRVFRASARLPLAASRWDCAAGSFGGTHPRMSGVVRRGGNAALIGCVPRANT